MKKIVLPMIISIASFALIGCGQATEKAAGKPAEKPAEKKTLKAADVSPDKAVKLDELVDSVIADQAAWKDKEVLVSAVITSSSGSLVTLENAMGSKTGNFMVCSHSGEKLAQDSMAKNAEIKGKISRIESSVFGGQTNNTVTLSPCVIKVQ